MIQKTRENILVLLEKRYDIKMDLSFRNEVQAGVRTPGLHRFQNLNLVFGFYRNNKTKYCK